MHPHIHLQSAFVSAKGKEKAQELLNQFKYPLILSTLSVPSAESSRIQDWLAGKDDDGIQSIFFEIIRNYKLRNAIDLLTIKGVEAKQISHLIRFAWGEQVGSEAVQVYQGLFWNTAQTTPMDWEGYLQACNAQNLHTEYRWKELAQREPFVKIQWELGLLPDLSLEEMLKMFVSLGSRASLQVLEEPYKYDPVDLMKLGIRAGTLLNKVQTEQGDEPADKQLALELENTEFQTATIKDLRDLVGRDRVMDINPSPGYQESDKKASD